MTLSDHQTSTLLHILLEECTANGGNFASPDSDLLFRRAFLDDWKDGDKTTLKALEELVRGSTLNSRSEPAQDSGAR